MNLMPWKKQNPANVPAPITGFQQELNRLFNNFFADFGGGWDLQPTFPAVSVRDAGDLVTVTAEVPGVDAEDIEVSADGNVLTIRGEKRMDKQEEQDNWTRVEHSYGSFLRRIDLPSAVDPDRAEASLEKGVLTLRLPKTASDAGKTIKVRAK